MRQRWPPVRGSGGARIAAPSRKPGSPQVEVVNRPGLIGRLDQRNLRLLTGEGSWPVNGHGIPTGVRESPPRVSASQAFVVVGLPKVSRNSVCPGSGLARGLGRVK